MIARMCVVIATLVVLAGSPSSAAADVVLDWNTILVTTLTGQNPFAQARFAAITHLAMFEAVNAIEGGYEPYLATTTPAPGASADAAAVAAAHRVLTTYFPGSAATLNAARATSLAAIPDGAAKDAGIALGESVAATIIALRAGDGAVPPAFQAPGPAEAGVWQTTPGCPPAGGILRHWGSVSTFGIESGQQFRSSPPPALSSRRYASDYNEVREVGSVGSVGSTVRSADRANVARFYAAVGAMPAWNSAARQVASTRGETLAANARTFALLNMAISDGLVSSMETKYHYNLWRPETAIRAGDSDGNRRTDGDPAFVPFIVTPCFPSYPSAHASAGYAAMNILWRQYGMGGHAIMLWSPAVPDVTLHYSSFEEITKDIDNARIYGGIHFRFDQDAGADQGSQIGTYIAKRVLRPVLD